MVRVPAPVVQWIMCALVATIAGGGIAGLRSADTSKYDAQFQAITHRMDTLETNCQSRDVATEQITDIRNRLERIENAVDKLVNKPKQ